MKKKVLNTMVKKSGGDDYLSRLHSYFKQQFKEPIIKMVSIRKSVFFIQTEKNQYVVKGYSRNSKLRLQETFTATLRQEGFSRSYVYLEHPVKEPLFFEGEYFGCMEYLPPNRHSFNFHSQQNREEGLALLEEFHKVTASFAERYKTLIPYSDLPGKWNERLQSFSRNHSRLRYFLDGKTIYELMAWAHWSLSGMWQNAGFFSKEPHVILHGDVAHHNFLRDQSGTLHLIDFDLISIGPECIDILQYANRILSYMDWDFEQLQKYPQMKPFLSERAFLYALAYPTDILREWNRIFKDKTYKNRSASRHVINLTLEQFSLRKQFVQKIASVIRNTGGF